MANTTTTMTKEDSITANTTATRYAAGITARMMIVCPPGLAKKDQLPPGLEKQLRVRGTLPPGLCKKMMPCPEELARRLPPPPEGYQNLVIGGHVALVNPHTYLVLDIFHVEL